jgi:hypothetical protein
LGLKPCATYRLWFVNALTNNATIAPAARP